MLSLTRRLDESIKIGDNINVMIVAIQGDEVRAGIAAPRDVPVHREEVAARIERMNGSYGNALPNQSRQARLA